MIFPLWLGQDCRAVFPKGVLFYKKTSEFRRPLGHQRLIDPLIKGTKALPKNSGDAKWKKLVLNKDVKPKKKREKLRSSKKNDVKGSCIPFIKVGKIFFSFQNQIHSNKWIPRIRKGKLFVFFFSTKNTTQKMEIGGAQLCTVCAPKLPPQKRYRRSQALGL